MLKLLISVSVSYPTHTHRVIETGSRSMRPKLMESERSAECYPLFKDAQRLLRDLYQSYKHTRFVSVFCTRVRVMCVDVCTHSSRWAETSPERLRSSDKQAAAELV